MDIENGLNNNVLDNNNEQTKFLDSTIGKVINNAIDIGIKYLMPDMIEDEIIEVKDALLQGGLKEGINTAIENSIELGKSAIGIVTGNFENVSQIEKAVKNGGIIDTVSNLLDSVVNKSHKKGLIKSQTASLIKDGKNIILENISSNLENTFKSQINSIQKLEKYSSNWYEYYNNKDFNGMEKEYSKIKQQLKEVVPLESTLKESRKIETIHNLIKNNYKNFDLNPQQLEAINKLN